MISKLKILVFLFVVGAADRSLAQTENSDVKLPMISLHRGANREAPENTLAAFAYAMELKINFIELDVRTTSDGKQVIMHDGSLLRTTGKDAKVQDVRWEEIQKLSAGAWFAKRFANQKVPLFEGACKLVATENKRREVPVNLYVDCKAINSKEVVTTLKKYGLLESAVFYGSVETLLQIKNNYGNARLMPSYPGEKLLDELISKINPYALDVPPNELNEATVALIHSKGVKVFSDLLDNYDNEREYAKAIQLEIDLIQTDDARAVLSVFKKLQSTNKQ